MARKKTPDILGIALGGEKGGVSKSPSLSERESPPLIQTDPGPTPVHEESDTAFEGFPKHFIKETIKEAVIEAVNIVADQKVEIKILKNKLDELETRISKIPVIAGVQSYGEDLKTEDNPPGPEIAVVPMEKIDDASMPCPQQDEILPETDPSSMDTEEPEPEFSESAEPELESAAPAEPELESAEPAEPEPESAEPAEPELESAAPAEPEPESAEPADPEALSEEETKTVPEAPPEQEEVVDDSKPLKIEPKTPYEAAVIKMIAKMRDQEGLAEDEIAKRLESGGIKAFNHRTKWDGDAVLELGE